MHFTPVPVPDPRVTKPSLHLQVTPAVFSSDEQMAFSSQPPLFSVQGL